MLRSDREDLMEKLCSFYYLARRNRIMLDLIVIVVTVVSFILLIGFTVGCDCL